MESLNPKVLGYHTSHNASIAVVEDGKISWGIEEERVSRKKHDQVPALAITNYLNDNIDIALHSTLIHPDQIENHNYVMNVCQSLITKATSRKVQPKKTIFVDEQGEMSAWFKRPPEPEFVDCSENHHLYHAALGFYNSGFEEAAVLVVDGAGAWVNKSGHEVETIYKASYPCNFEKISQSAAPWHTLMDTHEIESPAYGVGFVYSAVSAFLGFGTLECGTLMGLSTYGEEDPNIKPFVVDGKIDESLFTRYVHGIKLNPYPYIEDREGWCDVVNKKSVDLSKHKHLVNLAWRCQKDFETYMTNKIKEALQFSNNIVVTGGCALNCVANYEYLKHLPKNAKLYVEPNSTDAGISMGMAMYCWRDITQSKEIFPLKNLYLGPEENEILY